MASNYEEVVRKNRQYLTQAQIDALVAASKEYNIQNAGNRAGALASAREQFDTGYKGLQNMGLAGATPVQPTSGEVPRLMREIRTPFDDYNRRLNDVENQRLSAMGGQFAQQTRAARAAAAQQAAAERARQETLQQQYQRAQAAARAINVKSLPSAPKLNPRDLVQESVKEFDEPKTPAERAAQKYQQDGLKRTAAVAQQAALNAAAELLGVTGPNNMKQAEQVRLDREAATARDVQNTVTQATKPVLNQKTGDQYTYDTYSEAKEVQRAADNIAAKATRAAQANKTNDTTEQDERALKEAQANVDYIDSLYKKMAKGENLTDKEIQAMSQERVAVQQRDLAKEKLENPEKYAARLVLSDPTKRGTTAWTKATHLMASELADNMLESMGISKPNMTDEQFTADMQKVKEVRRSLDVIDSLRQEQENKKKTGTTGAIDYDQQFIEEELETLKKLGYTEEKARKLVKRVSNERQTRSEYEYYQKALETEFKNDGLKPLKPVNQSETDTTYRLANNLPSMNLVAKSDYEALATAPAGPAEYMNDKQRNTYNALYETEGIEAANKYVEDISPLLNLERARQDKDYREKMVNANWFSGAWQNLLSVGTNLIGNVPAMLEKLAITGYNAIANPDVPKYIDQNSGLSQLSNRTNYIREATSERILKNHNNTWGKVFNFAYQTGMSMADSAAAMGVAWGLGSTHAVDALFFSSAGNEAYRDARERGATQDQAMGFAVLSGAAEAIFEHVSVETFADQFIRENAKARRSTIAKLLIQAGTEASEEVTTEIANKLSDAWVMGDKSEYDLKVKELMSKDKTLTKEQAEKKAFMDALKDVGMAGLGGLVSGLGFGLTGAIATKKSETKTGKAVKENGKLDRLIRAAKLFGGDVAQQAAEVEAGKQSDAQVGSLLHELQLAQNEALGIDAESNEQITEAQAEEIAKKGEALDVIMEGEQITSDDAQKVIDTLGADKLNKMGYDASSADAFAKSYNDTLQRQNIAPMSEVNKAESEFAKGKAVEELREESFERVYKNPKQGLAYQYEGKTVTPLPGNLTAVSFAEQERNNFKARTTATTGNVTYAFSGMQAREGMSNEQTLAEMQKALTKEARNKADVYQKLASALGIKMTIHDVMTGTNGFIDESGNMHVVLSGKQSVLRVAAHELTHWMKANNSTGYASLRQHLVNEVGADRFDRMLKQKAREYGIDTSTEKGRTVADDEVCAELCERMLSNEEALEKFAEKDTEAAKSLKDRLLKILNAIKQALKNVKNRDFGESWSDLIHEQDTIESWVSGLQGAIEKAENKVASDELLLSEEDKANAARKQETEALTGKGTYVREYTNAQVEAIIDAGMIGDKSNYEGDDYERARGMIAQSIPGVLDMMKDYNFTGAHDRINDVATEVVGMYTVAEGDDLANLRKMIPTVIGVDSTAKGDLKAQDQSLFQMSAKLSGALGRKVTLVSEQNAKGQKNAQYKTAEKLDELWPKIRDAYGLSDEQDFSIDTQKLLEFIESQAGTRKNAREYFGSTLQDEIDAVTTNMEEAMMNLYNEKYGATFSLDIPDRGIDMKRPVEGTDKLIAIHNLTGDELAKSLKRGGFPMPSIAIMKQSQGHNRYGDVSVIFGRETIDPKASKLNKVYGGDAWTPTYPTIDYKPNAEVENKISKKYYDLSKRIGHENARPLYNYVYDMERQLNSSKGEAGMLQKLYDDTDMMQLYLDDTGKGRVDSIYNETRTEMTKEDKEFYRKFIDNIGEEIVNGYNPPDDLRGTSRIDHRRKFLSDNRTRIENALRKTLQDLYGFNKEEIDNVISAADNRQMFKYLNEMTHLLNDGGVTVKRDIDAEATRKAIKDKAGEKEYRAWVDDLFKGVEEKTGIRNNKDTYTQTGNRRSFEALHYEDTLENVVKVMRDQNQTGNTAMFSGYGIWGVSAKDYKSVAEMKKDSSRLQTMPEENYNAIKRELGSRLQDIAQTIKDDRSDNHFIALDNAMASIVEAVRISKTKEGILRYLSKYHDGVTMDTVNQIVDLVHDIANMPTEYFEAKPMRAVGSEEIKAVILPEGQYKNVAADLEKRGVPVITYESGNDEDRLRALKSAEVSQYLFSLDTDAIRQAFTVIDTEGIEDGLEALKGVKHVGMFALKDISRMLDASAGKNKDLRNTLHAIFEKPHSEATGRYARGVERMQNRVMDIAKRAGVVDAKGKHFDSKKSAAIQNIGEGFSNTYTNLKLKVKDADHVTVKAYEPGTENLVVSEKDYTLKELRKAYGTNAADYVWSQVFDKTQKAQESGKQSGWVEEMVNTRPYTLADLQKAFPNEWQQLKRAADEFRDMYDEYIRDQNNMLATIYPIESEFDSEDRVQKAIDKKQERLEQHKTAVNVQLDNLQKRLEAKEQEMAGKKRTDTKAFRDLVEQANRIGDQIASVKSEIAEYEANVKEELVKLAALKAEYQNARQRGELDSLSRMHRLQYRSDYFHHFTEMASGIQNLRAIFTNNTDISPKIVGRSENTKAKSKWAGYFQERMGGDYTADAINGMLKYGQLAEYKLAFDPLTAYLRDVNKQIRNLDDNTNRDGLIRYIDQWADAIAGKSHKLDRNISDLGMAPRKAMQILNWINSRVIQNTLLFNARSALIQISNITNAKGIVKNNIDWLNGLRSWALAAKGDEAMADIMAQSNFLASRYMDNLQLTDSKLKSAKAFGGWMLGALDEISAKATWWAAYQQYTRNPNAAAKQYRTYDNAIDYADDVTRRTHAGRGVGELAPAMTSRVINFVAPFQVEVNNTFQLLKDNVKQGNYLGLLSTGLSVFLFNALFEGIVGSSPLQFDFIRAVLDIVLGFAQDDPKDDKDDYGILQAWQRLSGEAFGSLPYASQLASIIGEDTAKKLFGTDNDATRYGNTQIGVNAVVNAVKGVKDIGTGLVEGRKVNWVDDLDDLLNLTLPFGAKQLTRSIEGVRTVAKGYEGKYDKEGKEQVHFATDGDILEAIHAALFGKWSLTEASEYFGEKRLLPQLFGEYNGPKSSIGKAVDAKEYKAALETGITGKEYFTLKSDLSKFNYDAGKRETIMQQQFTPEKKADLDFLLIPSHGEKTKVEDGVLYRLSDDGEWKPSLKAENGIVYSMNKEEWEVKTDYTSRDMFDLSGMGAGVYDATKGLIQNGMTTSKALNAAHVWYGLKDTPDEIEGVDDRKLAFRNMLFDSTAFTAEEKGAMDLAYCGNKNAADYTDRDLFELSLDSKNMVKGGKYEKAKKAKEKGVPVSTFTGLYDKKASYDGENKSDYVRQEIMNSKLSVKQKELMDDLLVSDKGRNPDYSSQAWFEVSMLGKTQYDEAKAGEKVGVKPDVYLAAYRKYKEVNRKEGDKYVNTKKEAKALLKQYLDGLRISAPVYDYIWAAVFGYKSR